jgi:hypothetical protein
MMGCLDARERLYAHSIFCGADGGRDLEAEERMFFFEKKNKKTFASLVRLAAAFA